MTDTMRQSWHPDLESLRQKALVYSDRFTTSPAKLRWVIFHTARFEDLLAKLAELNAAMIYFLGAHQERYHKQLQHTTLVHVLQTHNKLDEILRLLQSVEARPERQEQGTKQRKAEDATQIEALVRFKALTVAIHDGSPQVPTDFKVPSAVSLLPSTCR